MKPEGGWWSDIAGRWGFRRSRRNSGWKRSHGCLRPWDMSAMTDISWLWQYGPRRGCGWCWWPQWGCPAYLRRSVCGERTGWFWPAPREEALCTGRSSGQGSAWRRHAPFWWLPWRHAAPSVSTEPAALRRRYSFIFPIMPIPWPWGRHVWFYAVFLCWPPYWTAYL